MTNLKPCCSNSSAVTAAKMVGTTTSGTRPDHCRETARSSSKVDDRDTYGFDDVLRDLQLLRHREEAAVGNALERRRDAEAGSPDRVETGLFDQLGAERVVGADRLDDPRPAHQLAELGG